MLKATAGVLPQSCLWHSVLFSEFRALEGQGGVEETVPSFLTALQKSKERHKEDCFSAAQNKQPLILQPFPISRLPQTPPHPHYCSPGFFHSVSVSAWVDGAHS